jgi:hypothetical protein
MPTADKFPNEKIDGADKEAMKVKSLEDNLRTELSSGGKHAPEARQALQHEVDLINYVLYERKGEYGKTVAERDPAYANKLAGQIERNDGYAENTSDTHYHMPAVQLVNGKFEVLPDKQISAEERLSQTNYKYGHLPASVDVAEGASILKGSQWTPARILPYEKEVFGTTNGASAHELVNEATNLRTAIDKVRMAITNHRDATKAEHELSTMVDALNKKGSDHINQLAMGLSRYDFKLLDNSGGKLVVKSDEQMKVALKPYM